MGNFTKRVVYEDKFDGDMIRAEFNRLKRSHMRILAPFMKGDAQGKVQMDMLQTVEMLTECDPIFKECMLSFEGPIDETGNRMTYEDIKDETYFAQLLSDMLSFVTAKSLLTKEAEEALKKRQADTSNEKEDGM